MMKNISVQYLILIILLFTSCKKQGNETLSVRFSPAFTFCSDFQVTKNKNGIFLNGSIYDIYPNNIWDTISPDTISIINRELTTKEFKILKDSVIKKLINISAQQSESGLDGMLISYTYRNQENFKKLDFWSPHEDDPQNEGFYITNNFIRMLKSTLNDSLHQDYLKYLETYISNNSEYMKYGPIHRIILEKNKNSRLNN